MRHDEEITRPPEGAAVLASSERCRVQAFRCGLRTYGFQYHFECDRTMIDGLMADAKTDLHRAGLTTDEFARRLDEGYEMFARLGDRLCLNGRDVPHPARRHRGAGLTAAPPWARD